MSSGFRRDPSLDTLLDFDGVVVVVAQRYWLKFEVREIDASPERPHGLRYSLTLHDPGGERIVGFDNAHPHASIGMNRGEPSDHSHIRGRVESYSYIDAAALLMSFFHEVDRALDELGVNG